MWWWGCTLVGTLSAGGKKLVSGTEVEPGGLEFLVKKTARLLFTEGRTHWSLETINGTSAAESPLARHLIQAGFKAHGEKLLYWKT